MTRSASGAVEREMSLQYRFRPLPCAPALLCWHRSFRRTAFLGIYAFGVPHLFLPRSPLHSTGRCGRGPFHRRVLFFSILVCGIAPAQSDGNTSALSFQFFSNQLYGLCRRARAGHVAVRHFRRACHLRSCLLSAKRPVVQLGVQSAPEHPDLCITGARPTYLFCFLY